MAKDLNAGAPASSEPRPENPYRTVHARMSPPGAAWDEGFAAGRAAATPDPPPCRCPDDWRYDDGSVFCPRHSTKPDAPAPASPDPPNEDAIRADERERLSARVYENGWCGTCGRSIEQ